MPQQDTSRSAPRKPGLPINRSPQRSYLSPEDKLRQELTFSISLQRLRESVENGWKVTWSQFDGEKVCGYLAGMDREHYMVYIPDPAYTERNDDPHDGFFERALSRAMSTGFELHRTNTFEDELAYPKMFPQVNLWKQWYVRSASKSPGGPAKQGPPRTGQPHNGDMPRNWTPPPGQPAGGPAHPHFRGA